MTDSPPTGTGPAPADDRGLRQLTSDSFDVAAAMGGVRGLIESVLPGLVFLVVFVITRDITLSVALAVGCAVVATIARLVVRTPITQAVGGLAGVVIGAVWAWRSGEAADFFAWGLWVNAGFATAMLVSVLARFPAVAVFAAGLTGHDLRWRDSSDPAAAMRRFRQATWLWCGAFLARLAVQVPLYFNDEVGWLGTARLVMGAPMWVLVLWITWIMVSPIVREPAAGRSREDADPEPS
ncbi:MULTISPECIES: DUF3159 domain-containing protein [unclassified Pseudactinotalea]|uniref:DUF3159 domain-containing protein n=1 Tax=unclassified Pseudactinotalea TaxID=2649176 RepID=UPI00128AE4F7|nr:MULTISPECIES: DUF3159 domain-containing protein [unclassified Pseudactinotalea]MPV49413.1 DUF3159 domain-containing protein [Pseudactinotalea sp. HY160]QGH69296.1 DUF3159 domain-containing protein [Pseudactinotalea sp. HY158]